MGTWIKQFVDDDPNATEEAKAKRPLVAAEVSVAPAPGIPGWAQVTVALGPRYQLEGIDLLLSIEFGVPLAKGGGADAT